VASLLHYARDPQQDERFHDEALQPLLCLQVVRHDEPLRVQARQAFRRPSYRRAGSHSPEHHSVNGRILSAPHRRHRGTSTSPVNVETIAWLLILEFFAVWLRRLCFAVQAASMLPTLIASKAFFGAHAAHLRFGNTPHRALVGSLGNAGTCTSTTPTCVQP
jgi:hypothetical protein